jgi:hypothetical protein
MSVNLPSPSGNEMTHYFSHSKVKAFRRCKKVYDYKYLQGLERRQAPHQLARGVIIHSLIDAHCLGNDYKPLLEEYREKYSGLWDDEAEGYSSPDEIESLFLRYLKHWSKDTLKYEKRSEVDLRVIHKESGLGFHGILDKIPSDFSGRKWVMDHKTHKVLPDEATRFADIQTVLYHWAAGEAGVIDPNRDGVMWDYIRTKPPAVPEVLKSGKGLSRRANMDTDFDTYMGEILKNGFDPADYVDELNRARDNTFFMRIKLPSPNKDMVKQVVEEFFDTAQEILDSKKFPRNMTRDCKSCSYFQVCQAELRGLDSSFIRKSMYQLKEVK